MYSMTPKIFFFVYEYPNYAGKGGGGGVRWASVHKAG